MKMNVCYGVEFNLLDHAENITCFVNRVNEGMLFHNWMIGEIIRVSNCENSLSDLKYFVLFVLIVVTTTVFISILPCLPSAFCVHFLLLPKSRLTPNYCFIMYHSGFRRT